MSIEQTPVVFRIIRDVFAERWDHLNQQFQQIQNKQDKAAWLKGAALFIARLLDDPVVRSYVERVANLRVDMIAQHVDLELARLLIKESDCVRAGSIPSELQYHIFSHATPDDLDEILSLPVPPELENRREEFRRLLTDTDDPADKDLSDNWWQIVECYKRHHSAEDRHEIRLENYMATLFDNENSGRYLDFQGTDADAIYRALESIEKQAKVRSSLQVPLTNLPTAPGEPSPREYSSTKASGTTDKWTELLSELREELVKYGTAQFVVGYFEQPTIPQEFFNGDLWDAAAVTIVSPSGATIRLPRCVTVENMNIGTGKGILAELPTEGKPLHFLSVGLLDSEEAIKRFHEISRKAGVYLPLSAIQELKITHYTDTVGLWLLFLLAMLHDRMPHHIIKRENYILLTNPFAASVRVLEILIATREEVRLNSSPEPPEKDSQKQCAPASSAAEHEIPEIPSLAVGSPDWIKNTDAATLEGVQTETLGDYRNKRYAYHVASDGMSGIDRNGRMWRRPGTPNSHPYYYVPSLKTKKNQQKTAEKTAETR